MKTSSPTEKPTAVAKTPDVPAQVFEEFLGALGKADVAAEATERLRKTLLIDKAFTERALKDAIFGEQPQ